MKVEPTLQPLTGQGLQGNLSDEARSDVTGREFLGRGQITFFDCGIFAPSKTLRKWKRERERKNKKIQGKGENTTGEIWM